MTIKLYHAFPPVPFRHHDWMAYDDQTYDGPGSPYGHGPTREAAIADLMVSLDEEHQEKWDRYYVRALSTTTRMYKKACLNSTFCSPKKHA
jgi:hypothetical protein